MTSLLRYGWEGGDTPAPTTTGSGVSTSATSPIFGTNSRVFTAGDTYDQWTQATTLTRRYYCRFYLNATTFPSALARVFQVLDTGGSVVVNIRLSTAGVLQMYDSAGNPVGNTYTIELGKAYLIEPSFTQQAAGNGALWLKIDNEDVNVSVSAGISNTATNRFRFGINTASPTASLKFDLIGINDDQSGSNNTWVGGTVFPGTPAEVRPSGTGRRPVIPCGISQVNNVVVRAANDRLAVRFVPDTSFTLYRFLMGFNMEGVDTDEVGAAAPSEIKNPGGTGRSGYADGNGGIIRAQLCPINSDGTPNLSSVLATESVNAVQRYKESKALYGTGLTQMFYLTFNTAVTGGTEYCVVISNTDAAPTTNWFSVNCPTTALSAGGPHRSNTRSKYTAGAMAGLDPRECVFWSINTGTNWVTGENVGGDMISSGFTIDRPGGHITGYYSGIDVGTDEAVRLPWYGYQPTNSSAPIEGIQPYFNYLATLATPTLTCRRAGRSVTLTQAGGFAPSASSVGVVTVTNVSTSTSATTSSLGSGLVTGNLSGSVSITAGDTFTISATGTVYLEKADSFLVSTFGLGGGDFPFTTGGSGNDRAALFAL